MERLVLRWLCQETGGRARSHSAAASLEHYRWREPLHQVIFDVVMTLPPGDAESARSLLTARLTRRGFPDIPDLFQPHGLSESSVEKLIANLLK